MDVIPIVIPSILLMLIGWKWKLPISFILVFWILATVLSQILIHISEKIFVQILISSVTTVAILASILLIRFYRDPERRIPSSSNIILCPADGIIRYIRFFGPDGTIEIEKNKSQIPMKDFIHGFLSFQSGLQIGIEMRICDVHVNRSPITGRIIKQEHQPGPFKSLRQLSGLLENERVVSLIQNEQCQCIMVQIASRLVRRIVSYQAEGESVQIGDRIGMIRLGSQVDVIIPILKNLRQHVKEGEFVKAGETVLATYDLTSKNDHE